MPTPHLVAAVSVALAIAFAPLLDAAASAASHSDDLVLTINSPAKEPLELNLAQLDEMTQREIETSNEFVSGEVSFSGPLARDIVEKVGGNVESTIILTAANEYQISVPADDFFKYDVVLATRMDGALLSRRDKGPIWLMYPISDHPELQDSAVNSKLIWQLVKLEVR